MAEPVIETQQFTKVFGRQTALNAATLNVAPGALTPFLGGRLDFCALLPGYATAAVGFDVAP